MEAPHVTSPLADLRARLPDLMLRDRHRLERRLDGERGAGGGGTRNGRRGDRAGRARGDRPGEPAADPLAALAAEVEAAERRVARRRAAVPALSYPAELPVSQRRDDLLAAIRDHQVVIVAGETGSGKTTQIPKMCLELGRGVLGTIGHTQPRRIAARTVAERIAEELDTPLGEAVGYTVRFTDKVGDRTLVKLMTDGILLAEIQRDRMLRRYDTLIVDEAHERSLNVDFLLGYLKQLLPRRPDLKLIITSATIDPGRFSRHFDDAPIVEVSGRTYPVEVRYRPVVDPDAPGDADRDQTEAIVDAVNELAVAGPGDVLVFLSGEREIRDTADALGKAALRNTEVLPLYGRLSAAEQHRVFQPHTGRRVVLATNVAETSLTVPGIRYVVDPGTARISRYSHRTKVQRLPIEPISQASANQRKGRCGRTSDGICIRLYTEEDFEGRPEFTEPEILRTNLASVILQMTALGLGDVAAFPFLDPPDRRNVTDGVRLLEELSAFEPGGQEPRRLTPLGRDLAQLPVDPRLGRMVLAADRNGCVHEVLVLAAALSIQDPRERPTDAQQAADAKHLRFADQDSDFTALLNLWRYLQEKQDELSSSAFRRLCRAEYLHYLRVREWQDLYAQLRQVVRTLGITPNTEPATPGRVHASLLAGLLSQIGLREGDDAAPARGGDGRPGREARGAKIRPGGDYLGARGARFAVFPGSALFRRPPRWVMAAELVETSRLWARTVAKVDPKEIEDQARHLVVRVYSEPHWEKKRAAAVAFEKVTLYGIPIVTSRKVDFGRIDPVVSRELFLRHALVEGDWHTFHAFFAANRALLDDVEDLERRARRRDIVVDDETLHAFYDARIPADVVSGAHFDAWWKKTRRTAPDLLDFSRSMLVNEGVDEVSARDYPDGWRQGDLEFPLTYQFEPGADADGVTVHLPLAVLNQVTPDGFDWQIPGLREDLVVALIRGLPKAVRTNFIPAPNYARLVLDRVGPQDGPLLRTLDRELRHLTGLAVPPGSWAPERVPHHLRMTFRVEDEHGATVAEGKDLEALKAGLVAPIRAALRASAPGVERSGLRTWDLGTLPRVHEEARAGHPLRAYPALVDEGDTVAVRLFDTEAEQRDAMARGTRRLLLLGVPSPNRAVVGGLSNAAKLALGRNPHGSVPALLADCVAAAVDALVAEAGGPAWDAAGFEALRAAVRAGLVPATADVLRRVEPVLAAWHAVSAQLAEVSRLPTSDVSAQVAGLVFPGFVTELGARRLPDVLRYLTAVQRRLEKLPADPYRDRVNTIRVEEVARAHREALAALPPGHPPSDALREIRWMIEELRVSLFAQPMRTAYPVSEQRIYRALDAAA